MCHSLQDLKASIVVFPLRFSVTGWTLRPCRETLHIDAPATADARVAEIDAERLTTTTLNIARKIAKLGVMQARTETQMADHSMSIARGTAAIPWKRLL